MEVHFSEEKISSENDRQNGIVILATSRPLPFLASGEIILSGGTFKSCPHPFEQSYVIFGANERKIQLVIPVPSGKFTFIHSKMYYFKKNQEVGVPIQIVNVVTDYEKSKILAIETKFLERNHFNCYFHYTHALHLKI